MRKLVYIIIIMHSCITYTKAQWPTTDSSFALVWGDEFNDTIGYNGMNCNHNKWLTSPPWNIDSTKVFLDSVKGWVDAPGYNLYYPYDTLNVAVGNGICRLKATNIPFLTDYWEAVNDSTTAYHQVSFNYSNGSLTSKKAFRFGYYEIKFRLPSNITVPSEYNAYQPTFWLFDGNDVIDHSEIDIFEIRGTNNQFTNGGYYRRLATQPRQEWHVSNVDTVTNGVWHTAAVNWDKNKIDYYYDGEYKRTETVFADSLQQMHMFIESYLPLFLGTNIPIHPTNTTFPYTYEIDYVRVYQRKEDCSTSKTYTTTTSSTFSSKLYKDLTLNTNCYLNNGNTSAIATDYVLLDAGTTIDNNMQIYIDVIPCNPNELNNAFLRTTPPSNNYNYRLNKP